MVLQTIRKIRGFKIRTFTVYAKRCLRQFYLVCNWYKQTKDKYQQYTSSQDTHADIFFATTRSLHLLRYGVMCFVGVPRKISWRVFSALTKSPGEGHVFVPCMEAIKSTEWRRKFFMLHIIACAHSSRLIRNFLFVFHSTFPPGLVKTATWKSIEFPQRAVSRQRTFPLWKLLPLLLLQTIKHSLSLPPPHHRTS